MSGKVSLYAVRHLADFLFQAIHLQRGSPFVFARGRKVNGRGLFCTECSGRRRALALLSAVLADAILGDPPSRFHPVAWMGSWIGLLRRIAPQRGPLADLVYGAAAIGVSALTLWLMGTRLTRYLGRSRWGWLAEGAVLSQLIAWRGLMQAGGAVARPLERGDLGEARRQLGWHLVSRDASRLDASLVAAATIESLAENSSDSVIAPLFWYAIGGLPAALVYRFLNTADAMLGYRDEEREWLGKSAARADDVVNLAPARLTALLIVAGAALGGGNGKTAWRIWRRDGGKTASPNAGQPMSAAAGGLEVVLEKVGHYRLGEGLAKPQPADIGRASRLLSVTVFLGIAVGVVAALFFPKVELSGWAALRQAGSWQAEEAEGG
ncbi:MAG: adenosylcobinamide-phosphate synthase CbiB [Caldilineaceae bacterium]|nr:adenosylcobinamide-phosphate synthase CbiB [Caldilineaceae bacterium]